MNWTKKLARFAPPGDDLRTALIAYVLALLVFVVFWGLGFFSGYRQALRELYEFRYGALVLRNGAVMASLNSLIRHRLSGFWVYLLVCGFNAAANYASFSRQTKSIYVMKRLPSAKELHVRCLTIPAVACAVGFLVSLILLAIFAAVYYHGVPARCMPPAETLQIWEAYF